MNSTKLTLTPSNCNSHACLLDQLQKILPLDAGDSLEVTIDMRGFLLPNYLTLICCTIDCAMKRGVNVETQLISGNNMSYAARLNFLSHLNIEFREDFNRRDSSGRFLEITNFDSDNGFVIVDQLSKILINTKSIDTSLCSAIDYSFGEIIDNVNNHSQAINDGWVSAQYYEVSNKIRIIVADAGRGIRKALNTNEKYKDWNTTTALEECTVQGVTSNGRGNGLFITSEFIKQNNGLLLIHTENKKRVITKTKDCIWDSPNWQGTFVYLEINTNNLVDLDQFIETLNKTSSKGADFSSLRSTHDVFLENFTPDETELW